MRYSKLFYIIIFFTLSLYRSVFSDGFEILCYGSGEQGLKKLKETAPDLVSHIKHFGIDFDSMPLESYFAESDSEGDFLFELRMDSERLGNILMNRGYEEDYATLNGENYSVWYLLGDENSVVIFDDRRVYLSNNITDIYEKISKGRYFESRISEFISSYEESYFTYIFPQEGENIYGQYEVKAMEYAGNSVEETFFYKKNYRNLSLTKIPFDGKVKPIMTYDELASLLIRDIPEVEFRGDHVKSVAAGEIDGAFLLEKDGGVGVALMIKNHKYRNYILKRIYTQDIFEKIGVDIKIGDNGLSYLKFPFFQLKKYIIEFENGVLITSDRDVFKKKTENHRDEGYLIDGRKITLKYREDIYGYFGSEKGAFSIY